ncbi:MAG TPA: 2-oxo-4-hydroxy-4-carboxy-5-ureidoimidazoline decarboxylase [Pyrinomonadaceae bacterium]|nr:2-oxo-4-hydroxy-4-carboxy-5-ureidoimidazoline decarboxylase [Pyrinomonadaceae bacterium]
MSYPIYKNLADLNDLPREQAVATFLDCCGSSTWATRMADERPFVMVEQLFEKAGDIWFALSKVDHLEAFAAHPQIGSSKPADAQAERAADWSKGEQASVAETGDDVRADLAAVNRLYHEKFGFIFIISATGKTAEEVLAIAKARVRNSVETELKIAAEEQNKITQLRLTKLLERQQ